MFELELARILFEKIVIDEIALSVAAQNHIRGRDGEHVGLKLYAMQLFLSNAPLLSVVFCMDQHIVQSCNEKSGSSAAGVEYNILGM